MAQIPLKDLNYNLFIYLHGVSHLVVSLFSRSFFFLHFFSHLANFEPSVMYNA